MPRAEARPRSVPVCERTPALPAPPAAPAALGIKPDLGKEAVPDDGAAVAKLLAGYFARRGDVRADVCYALVWYGAPTSPLSQDELFATKAGITYLQAAYVAHPAMAEHRAYLSAQAARGRLRAHGAPCEFVRFTQLLQRLGEIAALPLDCAPESSFAMAGRKAFAAWCG